MAGIAERARGVERLHRGDDAQLLEARDVGGVDQLDVLDAVAAVARAVGGAGGGVGVEGAAHAGVADRVDGDLEAQPVGQDDRRVDLRLREQRLAAIAGLALIVRRA